MNKRQKKKTGLILPKKIKGLVRTYTELHRNQDEFGGSFIYVGLEEFEHGMMPKISCPLTDKTCDRLYTECANLYKYVTHLLGEPFTDYSCGYLENCRNYRIVSKIGKRVDFVDQTAPSVSYFVYQTELDDNYNGTVYIPLRNKKFLAYDFTM